VDFEKAMRLLCLKKKKYAAYLIGKDGSFKTEDVMDKHGNIIGNRLMMLKKGIILARRDNCKFLRDTYIQILDIIMNRGSLDEAINVLIDAIQNLLDGKVPHDDLVIIRELGSNYKSDSYFMKVFADDLKKAGKIVNPGDRLDFVIVEDPTATLLGHKMRLVEQYVERLQTPTPERIDYNYYIEKVLMNPINQLFEVGFKNEIAQLQHVSYKPTNRHKAIYLDRPVQIILKLRERGYDLKMFKEAVRYNVAKLKGQPTLTLNINPIVQQAQVLIPAVELKDPGETKPVEQKLMTLKIIPPRLTPLAQPAPTLTQSVPVQPHPRVPTSPSLILPRMAIRVPEVPKPVPQTPSVSQVPRMMTLNITPQQLASRVPAIPIINGQV
jgi:hypothetical protein